LKKYILFFLGLIATFSVKAQSGYNYKEFGWGFDVSYERGYTNITQQNNSPAFNFNLIYNYSPYLPIVAEFQVGKLSGGGPAPSQDPYGRQYVNHYAAFILHADIQLGTMVDYEDSWVLKILKNAYLGTGVGFIASNNVVQRTSIYQPSYVFPGSDKTLDVMVPLRAGYEFKIFDSYNEPFLAIDLMYIHNIAFGEGIDGYDDPSSRFKNNALNQYRQFTIGFKYYFGNVVSYNKLIRAFPQ